MSSSSPIASVCITPHTAHLITLSTNGTLRIFNPPHLIHVSNPVPNARHICASSTHLVLSSSTSPRVHFFSLSTFTLLSHSASAPPPASPPLALSRPLVTPSSPCPSGYFVVSAPPLLLVRSYNSQSPSPLSLSSPPLLASFSPSADHLAVLDSSSNLHVFSISSSSHVSYPVATKSFVSSLLFLQSTILSITYQGHLLIQPLEASQKRRLVHIPQVQFLTVSALNSYICVGDSHGHVRIWDPKANLLLDLQLHTGPVLAVEFTPDLCHVVSAGRDGRLRLLRLPSSFHSDSKTSNIPFSHQLHLLYRPSENDTVKCVICFQPFNVSTRLPILCGACGQTYACLQCHTRLWKTDANPKCTKCQRLLRLNDVTRNHDFIRFLKGGQPEEKNGVEPYNHVPRGMVSWIKAPEMQFSEFDRATVYIGKYDGEVALIRIPTAPLNPTEKWMQGTSEERHIKSMRKLQGPYVAQMYGTTLSNTPGNQLVVVMEMLVGGTLKLNLERLRTESRKLNDITIFALTQQLARIVRFTHNKGAIMGGGMDVENLGLTTELKNGWDGKIKMIELGNLKWEGDDIREEFNESFIRCLAPEVLRGGEQTDFEYRKMQDMYSLGVLIWEIAEGQQAFYGRTVGEIVGAVVGRGERPGSIGEGIIGDLVRKLWSENPEARGTSEEACQVLDLVPTAPLY